MSLAAWTYGLRKSRNALSPPPLRGRVCAAACLFAAVAGALPAPALAQQRPAPARQGTKPPEKEKEPPPPAEPPAPPYDRDLMRLSEIIGSLAFLRGLCGAPDAPEWPTRMTALLDAEGSTPARRDRLAGAYNRGYRGYSLTYRICTPAANEAAVRYIAEGERLSHALAGRFGG
ncbi:TIGR02301 family protein [Methylobacterium iners]|uniref:TIGR02301 family protein n=1 Tax=Methylobacterium iners TaxID=418707 RepID=A0ABQ4S606_9HYPH|nr:TIGR02301 family protein [Methylobacterium iners]GJD97110.1 hypothetical protein OCOJLMKI_4338 [Methylobacterium iners]